MALLTKTGANKILSRIWETGGLTQDMEEDLQRLRDDFDEREGMLRKFGEVYDGEDKDEYDYLPNTTPASDNDWEGKYNEMKQRYITRFFGGDESKIERDRTISEQKEDVKIDSTPQSWDDLVLKADSEEGRLNNAD